MAERRAAVIRPQHSLHLTQYARDGRNVRPDHLPPARENCGGGHGATNRDSIWTRGSGRGVPETRARVSHGWDRTTMNAGWIEFGLGFLVGGLGLSACWGLFWLIVGMIGISRGTCHGRVIVNSLTVGVVPLLI